MCDGCNSPNALAVRRVHVRLQELDLSNNLLDWTTPMPNWGANIPNTTGDQGSLRVRACGWGCHGMSAWDALEDLPSRGVRRHKKQAQLGPLGAMHS